MAGQGYRQRQELPAYLRTQAAGQGQLRSGWTPSAPGLPKVSGTFAGLKPLKRKGQVTSLPLCTGTRLYPE